MSSTMSGEVTIMCLTDEVILRDLGVHLTRGHRVNVPMSTAMRSRDLSAAKLDGTVSIQTLRSAAVRAQEYTSSDTVHSQAPRHVPAPPQVDLSLVVAALERLSGEVQGMREDLARLARAGATREDLSGLLARVEERLAQPIPVFGRQVDRTGLVPNPPTPLEEPTEMFIPSNLTGGAQVSDLKVSSETSDSPQLTGTAAALKAARKKR